MEYRKLGRSGVRVSEVALGSWLTYGRSVDAQGAKAVIRRAYELGINYFDTANVYAGGEAERIVGEALTEMPRDRIVLATKVFFPMGEHPNQSGLSRKHVLEQIDGSLGRLGVDYVDIYFAHRFDEDTPLDETLRAFDDLVRAGKVLYVGVSEWSANQMMEAHALSERMGLDLIVVNQPSYNMLRRNIEKDVLPTCRKLGIGQVVFSPLAQGVLTGKYSGGKTPAGTRGADPEGEGRFMGAHLNEDTLARVDRLAPIAADLGMTMPQLALAWCLRQDNVASVICGAKTPEQIADNAGASGKTIPPDALRKIDDILS